MDKKQMVHILLVEDEEPHAELVRRAFESHNDRVRLTVAGSLQDAQICLEEFRPDLVIADLVLPDGRGTELLPAGDEECCFPLVVMTSYGDQQIAVEAMKAGALDYVVKSETILADMPRIAERALREWGHIIERKRAEEELREREARITSIFASSPNAITVTDLNGNIMECNQATLKMHGYSSKDKVIGKNALMFISERDHPRAMENLEKTLEQDLVQNAEYTFVTKDGHEFPAELSASVIKSSFDNLTGFVAITRDITERKRAEEQIKASLEEKEVLLREIHHRVKNNMQIIISLLELQRKYITDERALEIFTESQQRIRSMALIHEKLYQSANLAKFDFTGYIENLTNTLFRNYVTIDNISFSIDVEDILLSIDFAIPCGLILNELVSNSLKHAFPEGTPCFRQDHSENRGKECEIKITLRSVDDNDIELIVSDNGVGIPADLDFRNTQSLGLQLVVALVNQIKGNIELNRTEGNEFRIKFKARE